MKSARCGPGDVLWVGGLIFLGMSNMAAARLAAVIHQSKNIGTITFFEFRAKDDGRILYKILKKRSAKKRIFDCLSSGEKKTYLYIRV